jgi:hypothetical protein
MSILLLALALAEPSVSAAATLPANRVACTVSVSAVDDRGRETPGRRVSAGRAPAVVFRGRTTTGARTAAPLLFDVFSPRGQRYQVLLATPAPRAGAVAGRALLQPRRTPVAEARRAVAGSSIALTSMYGLWRVEPRLEGADRPCGLPLFFTLRP